MTERSASGTVRCSRYPFCDETADLVVPAPDGSDFPICRDCYESDCGRCRGSIENDENVAKGLCQDCRDEIQLWGGDDERGIEKDSESEQTKLMTDGGQSTDGTGRYVVGDALAELRSLPNESAAVVCLDDAWARPARQGAFGVEYPTHDFETTCEMVDVVWDVLEVGGWLIADADDWLAPRLESYLRDEYGDVSQWYEGGGYRKRGSVTYVDASGEPDQSTTGQKLSNGGYPVVFGHKGETDRRTTVCARQLARQPRRVEDGYPYGWGSIKPIDPYRRWIEGLTDPGELVVVPCAGTAPAAIAAENLDRDWVAIDCEPGARTAYLQRRDAYLEESSQTTLDESLAVEGGGTA